MPTPLENWTSLLRVWWAVSGMLVLLMQVGFIYLEMGSVEQRNRTGIAIKNLTMLLVSTLAYFTVGFRIMYGDSISGILGWSGSPENHTGVPDAWSWVFLQAGFAAVAATIVSGAIAGRTTLFANVLIAAIVGGVVFPIYGHWVWGTGLLSSAPVEVHDFAGSGTVHFLGGTVALIGAWFARPRGRLGTPWPRRDANGRKADQPNLRHATVGVVFLWVGWIGFNGGSVTPDQLLERGSFAPVGEAIWATTVAAVFGGVAALVLAGCFELKLGKGRELGLRDCFRREILFRPFEVLTGTMGGMVAITANCDLVRDDFPRAALFGALGGSAAFVASKVVKRFVDDPVDAVAVHAGAGATGILLAGLNGSWNPEDWTFGQQAIALLLGGLVATAATAGVFSILSRGELLRVSYARSKVGLTFDALDEDAGRGGRRERRFRHLWKGPDAKPLIAPRPRFEVLGKGELADEVDGFLTHSTSFLSKRPRHDRPEYTIVCLPSKPDPEGLGRVRRRNESDATGITVVLGGRRESRLLKRVEKLRATRRRMTLVVADSLADARSTLAAAGLGSLPIVKHSPGWRFKLVDQMVQQYHAALRPAGPSVWQPRESRLLRAVASILTSIAGALLTGYFGSVPLAALDLSAYDPPGTAEYVRPVEAASLRLAAAVLRAAGLAVPDDVIATAGPMLIVDRSRGTWWVRTRVGDDDRLVRGGVFLDLPDRRAARVYYDLVQGAIYTSRRPQEQDDPLTLTRRPTPPPILSYRLDRDGPAIDGRWLRQPDG